MGLQGFGNDSCQVLVPADKQPLLYVNILVTLFSYSRADPLIGDRMESRCFSKPGKRMYSAYIIHRLSIDYLWRFGNIFTPTCQKPCKMRAQSTKM